jgi:hypothetical protein
MAKKKRQAQEAAVEQPAPKKRQRGRAKASASYSCAGRSIKKIKEQILSSNTIAARKTLGWSHV